MAITKFERWKTSEKNSDDLTKIGDGIEEKPVYENESQAVQLLHDKVHELTDLINTHITKMATNDAKVGITTAQANAITANTAKVSMVIGTGKNEAMAGQTNLVTVGTQAHQAMAGNTNIVTIGSNTTLAFGDLTSTTDPKSGKVTYSITLAATRDFGGKTGIQTKSTTIPLT